MTEIKYLQMIIIEYYVNMMCIDLDVTALLAKLDNDL